MVISLRDNMFELTDHLVGIYKTHNCSKSVCMQPSACLVTADGRRVSAAPDRPLLQQQRA